MAQHVIVGAGPIGSALTRQIADRHGTVTVVTRSGRGPERPGVTRVAADAARPGALRELCAGAATLFNCANPRTYLQWEAEWPPLAAALLDAAEHSGAVLVTLSNLYGYGPVDGPLTTDLPLAATGHKGRLRAGMWRDALARHEAGAIRATEVRAADYIGPEVTAAGGLLRRYADAVLHGRTAWSFGDPDVPHSVTYTEDAARVLVTVAADARAWGRAWHVPGTEPRTVRQMLADLADAVPGTPAPRIRRVPGGLQSVLAPVVPILRELGEVRWQFERPFVLDATPTSTTFGLHGTPWGEVVAATAPVWAPSTA